MKKKSTMNIDVSSDLLTISETDFMVKYYSIVFKYMCLKFYGAHAIPRIYLIFHINTYI